MKLPALFFIVLIGYGCAAKKMAIDNADTLISHQITKRLPLYSAQKDMLNRDIDKFLNRSKPQAQEIIPLIDEITLEDSNKVDAHYNKLLSFVKKLSLSFSKIMSHYMALLDGKQQKDLFETLDEENQDLLEKDKNKRLSDVEDRVTLIIGKLSEPQKKILAEYSSYFSELAVNRVERRKKLHQEFRNLYNGDISAESREKQFQDAFVNYQEESYKNKNIEIIKKIIPTLTKDQKEYFRNTTLQVKDLVRYFLTVDY